PKKKSESWRASDPENKVGQTSKVAWNPKKKLKATQGTTASSSGTSGTQSASKEIASGDLQSGATSTEMIGIEEAPAPEMTDYLEEIEVVAMEETSRSITPPLQMLSQAIDPETPTRDGKRLNK